MAEHSILEETGAVCERSSVGAGADHAASADLRSDHVVERSPGLHYVKSTS